MSLFFFFWFFKYKTILVNMTKRLNLLSSRHFDYSFTYNIIMLIHPYFFFLLFYYYYSGGVDYNKLVWLNTAGANEIFIQMNKCEWYWPHVVNVIVVVILHSIFGQCNKNNWWSNWLRLCSIFKVIFVISFHSFVI